MVTTGSVATLRGAVWRRGFPGSLDRFKRSDARTLPRHQQAWYYPRTLCVVVSPYVTMEACVFATVVVGLTAVWVYAGQRQSFSLLAWAMLFPTLVAVAMCLHRGVLSAWAAHAVGAGFGGTTTLHTVFGGRHDLGQTSAGAVVAASCLGMVGEVGIVGASASLALVLGWAHRTGKV